MVFCVCPTTNLWASGDRVPDFWGTLYSVAQRTELTQCCPEILEFLQQKRKRSENVQKLLPPEPWCDSSSGRFLWLSTCFYLLGFLHSSLRLSCLNLSQNGHCSFLYIFKRIPKREFSLWNTQESKAVQMEKDPPMGASPFPSAQDGADQRSSSQSRVSNVTTVPESPLHQWGGGAWLWCWERTPSCPAWLTLQAPHGSQQLRPPSWGSLAAMRQMAQ